MVEQKVDEGLLVEANEQVETAAGNETDSNAAAAEEIREEIRDDEAEQKARELMEMISDPNVLRAYRAIRNSNGRRVVSKEERKKKKAKRRMAKKSRR